MDEKHERNQTEIVWIFRSSRPIGQHPSVAITRRRERRVVILSPDTEMLPEGSFTSALLLDGLVNLGWGGSPRVHSTHEGIKSKVHPGWWCPN